MLIKHKVRATDRQIDAAIARAKNFEASDPRALQAEYEAQGDMVSLYFSDGVRLSIPRKNLQGLQDANETELSQIEIVGNGTGLHWPLLDVDHYVLGLLGHVFGTRKWMATIGRTGGLAKSTAKSAAARRNGSKGGRPRLGAMLRGRRRP